MIDFIAMILGWVLDILFKGLNFLGIGNVAIAIIIFTLIVKLLMLPLSIKQQKQTKLQVVMNPELNAIRDKYKGKSSDSAAMAKMQLETKAVYEKYGTSQWGSCIQLLIQMPILFALYRVFQKIPFYITDIKVHFDNILSSVKGVDGYEDLLNEINSKVDWSNTKDAITNFNTFTADQWSDLQDKFPQCADVIADNLDKVTHMNTFLGINMSQTPTFALTIAVLIPILAGLSQFISVKVSQAGAQMPDSDNPAAASMKMMTYFMPIMSAFIAFSVPAGLGIYWIATAVFQTIIYLCVNAYLNKIGVDAIIAKNVAKREKKRQKRGIPAESVVKGANVSTKNISSKTNGINSAGNSASSDRVKRLQERKEANDKKIEEILNSARGNKAKPGSLASKVNMVSRYNEANEKKKK